MANELKRLVKPVGERDHVRGPVDAPSTLVEYGDYQCPFCAAGHAVVEEVRKRMGPDLRFVYRHSPRVFIHPCAEQAAEAAEAAGAQGRFWQMHDRLFEHPDALDEDSLFVHAEALGLDLEQFAGELAARAHLPHVRDDFMSGIRVGVRGTPTFFVNGVHYAGRSDPRSLVRAIERARAAA